jgi:hypothetical protein
MDEVRKHSCSLWVSQWARCILWLITRQETVIQKGIIAPDADLTGVLKVYAANNLKLLAGNQRVLSVTVLSIDHLFVGLHVPIVIVLVFDRGLVKDLRGADMVAASEAGEKEPRGFWLRLGNGRSLF